MATITEFKTADPYKGVLLSLSEDAHGSTTFVYVWLADRIGSDTVVRVGLSSGGSAEGAFPKYLIADDDVNGYVWEYVSGALSGLYAAAAFATPQSPPTWHKVTGAPPSSLGAVGDRAVDVAGPTYYKKTGEAEWDSGSSSAPSVPLPIYAVSDDSLGNPTSPTASEIRSHADTLAAAYGNIRDYERPNSPILNQIEQGDMQATIYFQEGKRLIRDLVPRFIFFHQIIEITADTSEESFTFTIPDAYDSLGYWNDTRGGLMHVRGKSTGGTPAYELEWANLNPAGDAVVEGPITLSGVPASSETDDSETLCGNPAGGLDMAWLMLRRTDSAGDVKTGLFEMTDRRAYTYRRDLDEDDWVATDLSRRDDLSSNRAYFIQQGETALRFVRFETGEAISVTGAPTPSELTNVPMLYEATFGIGTTIYVLGWRTDEDNPAGHLWFVDFDGTPESEYGGEIVGMDWPTSASRILDMRATEHGNDIFVAISYAASDVLQETHLYRGQVTGAGMTLTKLANIEDADISNGGFILANAHQDVTEAGRTVLHDDPDHEQVTRIEVVRNGLEELTMTFTLANGYDATGKRFIFNGVLMPTPTPVSSQVSWTLSSNDANPTLYNAVNMLRAGGTVGISITEGSVTILPTANTQVCCNIVDHVTIENVPNAEIIRFEVRVVDGSGQESLSTVGFTSARAPLAPPQDSACGDEHQ